MATERQLQEAVTNLQSALERTSEGIDAKLLRTTQKNTFLCSAKCCDSKGDRRDLQECLERCSRPLMETEHKVKSYFEDFQLRHQRCIQRCKDMATEKMSVSPSQGEQEKAEGYLRKCAIDCCASYEKQIPQLQKNIFNS